MADKLTFQCTRDNDLGQLPQKLACVLELEDTALIGSSGTWRTYGATPERIFSVRSGDWAKAGPNIKLSGPTGAASESILMKGVDEQSGDMVGDGLVGGNVVRWTKT